MPLCNMLFGALQHVVRRFAIVLSPQERAGRARGLRGPAALRPPVPRGGAAFCGRRPGPAPRRVEGDDGVPRRVVVVRAAERVQVAADDVQRRAVRDDVVEAPADLLLAELLGLVVEVRGREADALVADDYGKSALHLAAGAGLVPVVERLLREYPEAGANAGDPDPDAPDPINARDKHGWTPLFHACHGGHGAAAKALIARGAKPGKANKAGQTALHAAVVGRDG